MIVRGDATNADEVLRSHLNAYPLAPPLLRGRITPAALRSRFDGTRPLHALLTECDPHEFAALFDALVWLEMPAADAVAAGGERVLVLGAAPEDAYRAIGGYLLARSGEIDCLSVGCFGDAAARLDEAAVSARVCGARWLALRLPDASTRSTVHIDARQMLRTLTLLIHGLIEQHAPTQVFAPAAIGLDDDRDLVCAAVRRIFEAGYFPDMSFHLYEPVPAAAAHVEIDAFLSALENAYVSTHQWFADIDTVAARKETLLSIARSAGEPESAACAAIATRNAIMLHGRAGGHAERFWRLRLTFGAA